MLPFFCNYYDEYDELLIDSGYNAAQLPPR